MEFLDKLFDLFKSNSVVKTSQERLEGVFTGPLIISLLFVFWEVPLFLFSKSAEDKIRNIKSLVLGIKPEEVVVRPDNFHYRMLIVLGAWIFWVYVFPFITPYLSNWRERLKHTSEARNKYDIFAKHELEVKNVKSDLVMERNKCNLMVGACSDLRSKLKFESDLSRTVSAIFQNSELKIVDSKKHEENLLVHLNHILIHGSVGEINQVITQLQVKYSTEELLTLVMPLVNQLNFARDRLATLEKDWETVVN